MLIRAYAMKFASNETRYEIIFDEEARGKGGRKEEGPSDLLGSKITSVRIWRGREADEGSEYFLHAVSMRSYTHMHTLTWAQQRVGHHRRPRGNAPPVESRGRVGGRCRGRTGV